MFRFIAVGNAVARTPDKTIPISSVICHFLVSNHVIPRTSKRSALVKTCAITKLILSVYYNARFSAVA